ncbi:MAG: AAA family ATPase [Deltaproteobacteria bacterium]|nr:AAA family ATPase [Deltaproteobacteria bacterium]
MTLKTLPLGDWTFSQLRKLNYLYADKTSYIYDLVQDGKKSYFLSRPRRFGKTLLLQTLKELFAGNRELFKGLWIDKSDYTFPKHPVLFLTLSTNTDTPELFEEGLLSKLSAIAKKANLEIKEKSPYLYFGSLIGALREKYNSKVAILIDEYDAPVTRNMGDLNVAQANAQILHNFFSVLKETEVTEDVRFTFVTGITRYALTSMDSGPNHLFDISLDPKYAGICGFTLDEFDSLFADRMEHTLEALKEARYMKPEAKVSDLKKRIYKWYNGYNWGGDVRVLNPFTILYFFDKSKFDSYWYQSGRPGHLTPLIQARPLDFVEPNLGTYAASELRTSELTQLEPVPVLFHSGYLTIDKIKPLSTLDTGANDTEYIDAYTFRLPNFEVSSSYYKDCFSVIFKLNSIKELDTMGESLKKSLLAKDGAQVSSLFRDYFTSVSFYQRPEGEKTFHAFTHLILTTLGFTVLSEVPGSKGRMDLCVQLSKGVYVIIELKYCPTLEKLPKKEENKILALEAIMNLSNDLRVQGLAKAVEEKLNGVGIARLFSQLPEPPSSKAEREQVLAQAAEKTLTLDERAEVLAQLARKNLPHEKLNELLEEASTQLASSKKNIDTLLSKATQKALKQITETDYHSVLRPTAKEIIDLAIAVYGNGSAVKAVFGT